MEVRYKRGLKARNVSAQGLPWVRMHTINAD